MPSWKTPKHPLDLNQAIAEWYLYWWIRLEKNQSGQEFHGQYSTIFEPHSGPDRRTREVARDYLNLVTYTNKQGNYETTDLWEHILETLPIQTPQNDEELTNNIRTIQNTDFGFIYPLLESFLRTYTLPDTESLFIDKIEEVLHTLPQYQKDAHLDQKEMEILLNYPPVDVPSWNSFINYIHDYRTTRVCPEIDKSNVWRNSNMVDFIETLEYDSETKWIVLAQ